MNPVMLKDPTLGLNLTLIGGITSLLPIAYAFSKGISGFLGSTMSPRLLLSFGLASTGLACLAFGAGSAPLWFAVFWAMNGLLQVCFQKAECSLRVFSIVWEGCTGAIKLALGLK